MKIAVNSIADTKIRLAKDIPAQSWEMDSPEVRFIDAVHIECDCFRVSEEIMVEAKVTTQREVTCSRCLALVKQITTQSFNRGYSLRELGEYLDLTGDIREEILLNFPMKILR